MPPLLQRYKPREGGTPQLATLDQRWDAATDTERRTLLDELVHDVTVQEDRLTVTLHGAPPLNVAFSEVGLKDSDLSRVGGGTRTLTRPTPAVGFFLAA